MLYTNSGFHYYINNLLTYYWKFVPLFKTGCILHNKINIQLSAIWWNSFMNNPIMEEQSLEVPVAFDFWMSMTKDFHAWQTAIGYISNFMNFPHFKLCCKKPTKAKRREINDCASDIDLLIHNLFEDYRNQCVSKKAP